MRHGSLHVTGVEAHHTNLKLSVSLSRVSMGNIFDLKSAFPGHKAEVFDSFLYIRKMAAAVLKTRSSLQMGSSLQRVDVNTISVPQLPDKKEWLAEYDVEILMLDG